MDSNRAVTGAEGSGSGAYVVRRMRWAETIFALVLMAYTALAVLANRYAYFEWDLRLAKWIQSLHGFGFDSLMEWISIPGSGWTPFFLVVAIGLGLFGARLRLEALALTSGVGLGALLNRFLKQLIGRPRPSNLLLHIDGRYRLESFPSGHVMFFVEFFGFAFVLCYVLMKRGASRTAMMSLLGSFIVLIGVSRVWLGAHWPSDVAGAYLAGGIWLFITIEFYRRLKPTGTE